MARKKKRFRGTPEEHSQERSAYLDAFADGLAETKKLLQSGDCRRALVHLITANESLGVAAHEDLWTRRAGRLGLVGALEGGRKRLKVLERYFQKKCLLPRKG